MSIKQTVFTSISIGNSSKLFAEKLHGWSLHPCACHLSQAKAMAQPVAVPESLPQSGASEGLVTLDSADVDSCLVILWSC